VVDANAADPLFAVPYGAPVRAERTADGILFKFLVESRLVHRLTA